MQEELAVYEAAKNLKETMHEEYRVSEESMERRVREDASL